MKKHNPILWIIAGLIGMLISLFFYTIAQASTIRLERQQNKVLVYIDPTEVNYTVNARIGFSGAKFISWTMTDEWLQLPVPYYWQNYDWGISRTAGYPGGFNTTTLFGTLELEATSSTMVWVEEDSMILDEFNKNVYE